MATIYYCEVWGKYSFNGIPEPLESFEGSSEAEVKEEAMDYVIDFEGDSERVAWINFIDSYEVK